MTKPCLVSATSTCTSSKKPIFQIERTSSRSLAPEKGSPTWVVRFTRIASSSTLRLPRKWMRATLLGVASSLSAGSSAAASAGTAQRRTMKSTALRKVSVVAAGRREGLCRFDLPINHGQSTRHVAGQLRVVRDDQHGHAALAVELEQKPT